MRSPIWRLFLCVATCAALAACETDDGDTPSLDGDVPDALIGAGGEGGEGGAGGVGGEGGMGGTGGIPDGPCSELDEDGCDAREDCAPRRDVFGAFVDCQRIEDVPCSMLDLEICERHPGCQIDEDICSPIPVACADQPDQRSCVGAGCHWWDDACHDEAEPARCDQPDPASCENAGCTWGDGGCEPTPPACADLDRQATCDARPDCRWNNNRCEVDPGEMSCAELDMRTCAGRADCVWAGEACRDRPEGACEELDYEACAMRPDCESNNCNCPPDAQCDCENQCWTRVFDCANVPIDACERTPGCMIESRPSDDCFGGGGGGAMQDPIACPEEQFCVPDEAFRCAQLDPRACEADPGCHLEWVDNGNCGGFDDGRGDADRAAPFPGDPGCQEQVCLPGGDGRVACEEIQDARECAATPGCMITEVCACDQPAMDPACQCEPGAPCPCLIAPPPPCECPICMDDPNFGCNGRDFDACVNDPSCRWEWGGGMEPVPGGGGCVCRVDADGREICECFEGAPVPPDEGWCVDNVQPEWCEGIGDERQCLENPECEWVGFDCGGCFIDERGNEVCQDCPMGGGFCQTRWMDPCAGLDEDICVRNEGCEWVPDANGGAEDPNQPEPIPMPLPARPAPCPCVETPEGEIICECDPVPPPPVGGYCQLAPPPGEQCWGHDLDACEADPECAVLEGGFDMMPAADGCVPCDEDRCEPCAALIAPIAGCVPVDLWCNMQPADACDPARCMVEEFEVCGGGGAVPPDCPPGEMCGFDPIPPPDGGECWVERVCVGPR